VAWAAGVAAGEPAGDDAGSAGWPEAGSWLGAGVWPGGSVALGDELADCDGLADGDGLADADGLADPEGLADCDEPGRRMGLGASGVLEPPVGAAGTVVGRVTAGPPVPADPGTGLTRT
jgi:hypothetical protein